MQEKQIDYYVKLVNELIDGVDTGDLFEESNSHKYRWEHLLALFYLRSGLKDGDSFFNKIYDVIIQNSENKLRQKRLHGETIKVYFQTYSAAQWPGEDLYRMFEKISWIDVKIVVSPLADRDKESILNSYTQTLQWFKDNNYNVVEGLNPDTGEAVSWMDIGDMPDVVYLLSSWWECLSKNQSFIMLPLSTLPIYIPYSLYLADSADGTYAINTVYNKEFVNLMWRVYCDSKYNFEKYKCYQTLKGKNIRYSGYSKMDYFYHNHDRSEAQIKELWGIQENRKLSEIKKILIAPHYSIFPSGAICYSTFQKNIWFWKYLIKKYSDTVYFIFKPHPNLRYATIKAGLFKSYEEYDEYVRWWDEQPNGKVVQDSSYLEYFDTSDAMIMDSGSFLGEYLYVGKPLLFLTRPEQAFMEIGKRVLDSYYQTQGENYYDIEDFINNIVINKHDSMADKRREVFSEEYDYLNINGKTATQYIFDDIMNLLEGREE